MSWPPSELTVATTSWMPDLLSRSASLASSAARWSAGRRLAWSTIRPVSAGKSAASAPTQSARTARTHAMLIWDRGPPGPLMIMSGPGGPRSGRVRRGTCRSELHFGRRLGILAGGELGHRLVGTEHGGGPQHAGE